MSPRAAGNLEIRDRDFTVESWERERRVFRVSGGAAADARVRTFYYPHWVASSNTGSLATRPGEDGALIVSLPEQAIDVTLEFKEPPRRIWSGIISLISWMIIFGALAAERGERRAGGESYAGPLQQPLSVTRTD